MLLRFWCALWLVSYVSLKSVLSVIVPENVFVDPFSWFEDHFDPLVKVDLEQRATLRTLSADLLNKAVRSPPLELSHYLCNNSFFPNNSLICTNPTEALINSGLNETLTLRAGQNGVIMAFHLPPQEAPSSLATQPSNCNAHLIRQESCLKMVKEAATQRLCALRRSFSSPASLSTFEKQDEAMKALCENPTSPLPISVKVIPSDGTRVYGKTSLLDFQAEFRGSESMQEADSTHCRPCIRSNTWKGCMDLGDQVYGTKTKITDANNDTVTKVRTSQLLDLLDLEGRVCDDLLNVCVDMRTLRGEKRLELTLECTPPEAPVSFSYIVLRRYFQVFISPTEPAPTESHNLQEHSISPTAAFPPSIVNFFLQNTGAVFPYQVSLLGEGWGQEKDVETFCQEIFNQSSNTQDSSSTIDKSITSCIVFVGGIVYAQNIERYHLYETWIRSQVREELPELKLQDVEGNTGNCRHKMEHILSFANPLPTHEVFHYCEIGFNMGHSSLYLLLNTLPNFKITAFDLGSHNYSSVALWSLHKLFPGRIQVVIGDSRVSVPTYTAMHPEKRCDMIFVDGGHTYEVASKDIKNMRHLAYDEHSNKTSIVIVDDLNIIEVAKAWEESLNSGLVKLDQEFLDVMMPMLEQSRYDSHLFDYLEGAGYIVIGVGTYSKKSSTTSSSTTSTLPYNVM